VHRHRAYGGDKIGPVDSLRGKLLVAAPPLVDPNFDRTVVLMLEHGEDGAIGIVLNRPSETELDDVFPEWRTVASPPGVVFIGGPVSPEAVIALGRGGDEADGFVEINGDLGSVDLTRDPLDVRLERLRVFAGYAGWAPGQLEQELEQGGWFVVATERADPFADEPEQLWRAVLRRQRNRVAVFANYPDEVSSN
jgi:putative transcriptional regulator